MRAVIARALGGERRGEWWEDALWIAGSVLAALVLAFLLVRRPWFAAGAVLGVALFAATLARPLVVIGAMLAIGAVDFSFLTGGKDALLVGLGGIDMNGIRLVGIVIALGAIALVRRDVWRRVTGRHGRWYALFLVYAGATIAFSDAQLQGARLWSKLAYPFLIFVAVLGVARTRADIDRLGDWTLLGAAVLTLVANPLYVLSGGYMYGYYGHLRLTGLGIGINPFSFYMLAMLLFAFARFSTRGQLRYLVLCGALGIWITLTLSRITLAGTAVGLGALALYSAWRSGNYRAIAGAALVGALVAVPLVPAALDRTFGYVPSPGFLLELLQHPIELYHMINWSGRDDYWPIIFAIFLAQPIFGAGLGSTVAMLGMQPHNDYLRLAADAGVVGCVLFAVAIGVWWVAVLRRGRRDDPLVGEFALAAVAAIPAWAVLALTDNVLIYYSQFTGYVGFFCAGALAAAELAPEEPDPARVAGA